MLSPVLSASGIDRATVGDMPTAAADAVAPDDAAVPAVPVSRIDAADLNSSVAGKLNMLLITARTQMIEALLDVLQQVSTSVGLVRSEGESDLAFAARVADTVAKMPAVEVEGESSTKPAVGSQSLSLRLLADALANPSGPQAQRVIAYLETARSQDRALPARIAADFVDRPTVTVAAKAAGTAVVPTTGSKVAAAARATGQNIGAPVASVVRPETTEASADQLPGETNAAEILTQGDDEREPSGPVLRKATPAAPPSSAPLSASPAPTAVKQQVAQVVQPPQRLVPADPAEAVLVDEPVAEIGEKSDDDGAVLVAPDLDPQEPAATPVGRMPTEPAVPKTWTGVAAAFSRISTEQLVALVAARPVKILLEGGVLRIDEEAVEEIEAAVNLALTEDGIEAGAAAVRNVGAEAPADPTAGADPARTAAGQMKAAEDRLLATVQSDAPLNARQMMKMSDVVGYTPYPYGFAVTRPQEEDREVFFREDHDRGHGAQHEQEGDSENPAEDDAQEPQTDDVVSERVEIPEATASRSGTDLGYSLYRRMGEWDA